MCALCTHTPHALYVRSFGEFSILRTLVHIMSCHACTTHLLSFACPPPHPLDFRMFSWLNLGVCWGLGRHNSGLRVQYISLYCVESAFYGEFFAHFYDSQVCVGVGAKKKNPLFFLCTWVFANNLLFKCMPNICCFFFYYYKVDMCFSTLGKGYGMKCGAIGNTLGT